MAEKRFDVGMDPDNKGAQGQMWDSWWYDRFEIPHAIPADARRLEMEMGGERFGAVLLDHVAPKTCRAFWDVLPYTGNMIHCAWFGHAAFYLDRVPLLDALGYELENRFQRLAPGDIVWDPYIEEVTIAYGRNAFVNFPTTIYSADGRVQPRHSRRLKCVFRMDCSTGVGPRRHLSLSCSRVPGAAACQRQRSGADAADRRAVHGLAVPGVAAPDDAAALGGTCHQPQARAAADAQDGDRRAGSEAAHDDAGAG